MVAGNDETVSQNTSLMSDLRLESTSNTIDMKSFLEFSGPFSATNLTAESNDPPEAITDDIRDTTAGASFRNKFGLLNGFSLTSVFM